MNCVQCATSGNAQVTFKGMTPISLDEGGRCETPVGCIRRPLPMVLQVPVADPFLKLRCTKNDVQLIESLKLTAKDGKSP